MERVMTLLLMGAIASSIVVGAYTDVEYATIEGVVSLSGSEPFVDVVVVSSDGTAFTLSGDLSSELRRLVSATVRVTGMLKGSRVPQTEGDIHVERYSIVKLRPDLPGSVSWAIGTLRSSRRGIVLVGEDQIIYEITNAANVGLSKLIDAKVVIMGTVQSKSNFIARITVGGYIVLREPKLVV